MMPHLLLAAALVIGPALCAAPARRLHESGQWRTFEFTGATNRHGHPGIREQGSDPRSPERWVTPRVTLRLVPGANVRQVRANISTPDWQPLDGLHGWYGFDSASAEAALDFAERLRAIPGVAEAHVQVASQRARKFVPNDPLFASQWHLLNTGQNGGTPGIDINVTNTWNRWRGSNVVVAVVDDGLQLTHPDITNNITPGWHWDFNETNADPSPRVLYDYHGTKVGGVIGARGNNNRGVSGVAPEVKLVGLRLIALPETDEQDAAAMLHSNAVIQIKNNSWGAYDGDASLQGAGPLMRAALRHGVTNGRAGLGTIYVFAAGNGRAAGEDANLDGFVNPVECIAVGALSDLGQTPAYGEPAACLAVVAPSGTGSTICAGGRQNLTTTDLVGSNGSNRTGTSCETTDRDYTANFSGTSAAAPVVSGVAALVLGARPDLGYRDVKEVLMRSARRVVSAAEPWTTNWSGFAHHHALGAGLVDAGAAVSMATNWAKLGSPVVVSMLQTNLAVIVPDGNTRGITNRFVVTNKLLRVEHATLTVTLPHTRHGDLVITLISPRGVESRLAELHYSSGEGYKTWTFSSVRHWGEPADGTWLVRISDEYFFEEGILQALHLELHGSQPVPQMKAVRSGNNARVEVLATGAGWKYDLLRSSNLVHWSSAAVLSMGVDGRASWTGTNVGSQFFRLRRSN